MSLRNRVYETGADDFIPTVSLIKDVQCKWDPISFSMIVYPVNPTNRRCDRQTDRKIDRQTDRQIDRQTDRQSNRQTDSQKVLRAY